MEKSAGTMVSQEDPVLRPILVFPSRTRKYVRLTPNQAYSSMLHVMRENMRAVIIEGSSGEVPSFKARLGGNVGATAYLRVLSEGEVSTLEFSFSYRNAVCASFVVLAAMIGLSLVFLTPVPAVGCAFVLFFAFRANSAVVRFLDTLNETLPHIEREYARRTLMEDRERWGSEPRDTEELLGRLCEKHKKMWGNTNVLWYKINEYQRQGLMYNEAVRKIAEEEGINQR